MRNIEMIKRAEDTLTDWVMGEIGCGKESVALSINEFGELVDALKDLSEMEKNCYEAEYYRLKMFENSMEDEGGLEGYDNRRYSSGRFAPKGYGHYAGYVHMDENTRINGSTHNSSSHMYGYGGRSSSQNGSSNNRQGYPMNEKYGYHQANNEKQRAYEEYCEAKEQYDKTTNQENLKAMQRALSDYVSETVMELKEISESGPNELKDSIKKEVKSFLEMLD